LPDNPLPASQEDERSGTAGPQVAAAPRIPGGRIFLGPQGLRAGWSLLVFAGLILLLMMGGQIILATVGEVSLDHGMPAGFGFLYELLNCAAVFAATWVMAKVEDRPVTFFGYRGRSRGARFLWGVAWGFAAISAFVLVLRKLGYLALDGAALHSGTSAAKYAAAWAAVFLLAGLFEESAVRGYAQFTMTRGLGFWWGAILLSFLFGFTHRTNPGESPLGLFAVGGVGLVLCLSLWYTGSLWWAVGFHAAWDWGESFFYGTADSGVMAQGHLLREHPVGPILWSGGATGPEGSVLVFPLLLVIAIGMVLWWGRWGEKPFTGRGWRPGRVEPQS
jgi:uncharacterized protein